MLTTLTSFDQVINNPQTDFRTLKVWFYRKFLVLNPQNCHFMTPGNGENLCNFACNDITITNSLSVKILGLIIDNNLDFSDQISEYLFIVSLI